MRFPALFFALTSLAAFADGPQSYQQEWGVGIGVRSATVPYNMEDNLVHDVLPLLFYQGERFYLDGFNGGFKLYSNETITFDVLGKFRFLDIPKRHQNKYQGSQFDFGSSLTWHYTPKIDFAVEVLSDSEGRVHSNLTGSYRIDGEGWQLKPEATLRYKTASFNDTYYGLGQNEIGSQVDYYAGAKGRYQLYQSYKR